MVIVSAEYLGAHLRKTIEMGGTIQRFLEPFTLEDRVFFKVLEFISILENLQIWVNAKFFTHKRANKTYKETLAATVFQLDN